MALSSSFFTSSTGGGGGVRALSSLLLSGVGLLRLSGLRLRRLLSLSRSWSLSRTSLSRSWSLSRTSLSRTSLSRSSLSLSLSRPRSRSRSRSRSTRSRPPRRGLRERSRSRRGGGGDRLLLSARHIEEGGFLAHCKHWVNTRLQVRHEEMAYLNTYACAVKESSVPTRCIYASAEVKVRGNSTHIS